MVFTESSASCHSPAAHRSLVGRCWGRRLASGEGRPGLLSPEESLGFRAARRPSESDLISPPCAPRLAKRGSASSEAGTGLLGEEGGVRTLPSSGGGDGPRRTRGLHVGGGGRGRGRSGRPEIGTTPLPALPCPGPSHGPRLCAHVLPCLSFARQSAFPEPEPAQCPAPALGACGPGGDTAARPPCDGGGGGAAGGGAGPAEGLGGFGRSRSRPR